MLEVETESSLLFKQIRPYEIVTFLFIKMEEHEKECIVTVVTTNTKIKAMGESVHSFYLSVLVCRIRLSSPLKNN